MPTTDAVCDTDINLFPGLSEDTSPPCECSHGDGLDLRCGRAATVRVSVKCIAEGCTCSAGVYLLCARCLSVWQRNARDDGVRLTVRPL
jgi:hypothetical protein